MVYRYVRAQTNSKSSSREQHQKDTRLTITAVAYSLGIYLLNLFLAFISPKFDPSLETDTDMEDGMPAGQSSLPTKSDEEFKPFVRRLPEFKFWHSATRAVCIAFACSWSEIFNLPVFWPVLVVYWLILVFLTMRRQIQSMIKYRYVELLSREEFRLACLVLTPVSQVRSMGLWQGQVQGCCEVKEFCLSPGLELRSTRTD